jgi:hypothetical protein
MDLSLNQQHRQGMIPTDKTRLTTPHGKFLQAPAMKISLTLDIAQSL